MIIRQPKIQEEIKLGLGKERKGNIIIQNKRFSLSLSLFQLGIILARLLFVKINDNNNDDDDDDHDKHKNKKSLLPFGTTTKIKTETTQNFLSLIII
jgi:hypothetical protein